MTNLDSDIRRDPNRRLRVYALDPSLGSTLSTRGINELTIDIPWDQTDNGAGELSPGPVGEYLEVIDYDPASGASYQPVDLNQRAVLATDGLDPSEADPQFHQQMVYAVAMATIHRFVRAFGRPVFWSNHYDVRKDKYQFVPRLRIYPHALRARNAYYSPTKKALLFGYFPVTTKDRHNTPGTLIFTCLSHDIIAHEVTHALLDGIHPRFNDPSNPDVLAFHEAFSDLVALFQRFSYPGVLESEIVKTRGDLSSRNMLAQLANQFGRATGHGASLRDALGGTDPETGKWVAREPDPHALERETEPHRRGSFLVAAVFRAFTLVYRDRVADLYRIATQGTGVLPEGDIPVELADRLAREARETADHILQMCIRAIDYCPPFDITFGDFLRAVITADVDINPEDAEGYRVAFVESFRSWGIYPPGIRAMSVESLILPQIAEVAATESAKSNQMRANAAYVDTVGRKLQSEAKDSFDSYMQVEAQDSAPTRAGRREKIGGFETLDTRQSRFELWKDMDRAGFLIWRWLTHASERHIAHALGLIPHDADAPLTVFRNKDGNPTLHVQSVRPIHLKTDDFGGQEYLVVEVLQKRRGYLDPEDQHKRDSGEKKISRRDEGDFIYRAGCTFFINPQNREFRWVIRTAGTIADDAELERMRKYLNGESLPKHNEFAIMDPSMLGLAGGKDRREPFAMLHDS